MEESHEGAVQSLVTEEHGQDLIEYALLAGFVSVAAGAAITSIGPELASIYGRAEKDPSRR
jgi:Flp pilus assembly pilin Flp